MTDNERTELTAHQTETPLEKSASELSQSMKHLAQIAENGVGGWKEKIASDERIQMKLIESDNQLLKNASFFILILMAFGAGVTFITNDLCAGLGIVGTAGGTAIGFLAGSKRR